MDSSFAPDRFSRAVACCQGFYYVLTGAWPCIAPTAFQLVSGFKLNLWLAQTVGVLLVIIGGVLLSAARANRLVPELVALGGGAALTLGVVDVFCVYLPGATHAYWLDAPIEFALVGAWLRVYRRSRRAPFLKRPDLPVPPART